MRRDINTAVVKIVTITLGMTLEDIKAALSFHVMKELSSDCDFRWQYDGSGTLEGVVITHTDSTDEFSSMPDPTRSPL